MDGMGFCMYFALIHWTSTDGNSCFFPFCKMINILQICSLLSGISH